MTSKTDLMAAGMPGAQASRLGLDVPTTALTATGNSQVTALSLISNFSIFGTVAASTGAILSAREGIVVNGGANPLTLYPPVGGNINGGTTNAGLSIPAGKAATFASSGLTYGVNVSA